MPMLSHPYRLPATTRLLRSHFLKTPLFGVKYTRNGLPVSRFAFIVRKTVAKKAVVRNRIRRVFRSCIEEQLEQIQKGYDMLFFLERGIIEKRQKELSQEIRTVFAEKKLLQ